MNDIYALKLWIINFWCSKDVFMSFIRVDLRLELNLGKNPIMFWCRVEQGEEQVELVISSDQCDFGRMASRISHCFCGFLTFT